MAKKYDHLLTLYFKGTLHSWIRQREQDLRTPVSVEQNNANTIRAKNTHGYGPEDTLIRIEEDEDLQLWNKCKDMLDDFTSTYDQEHKDVFDSRYRTKISWAHIEFLYHISDKTGQRWIDDLQDCLNRHNVPTLIDYPK